MLSAFESALLDRHLGGCAACRSFARSAAQQTAMLRDAELEQPEHRVVVPTTPRVIRRRAASALSAALVAAAAAAVVFLPGGRQSASEQGSALRSVTRSGAPVLVVFAASPSPSSKTIEVPRLRLQPASVADGPVHGHFSAPF